MDGNEVDEYTLRGGGSGAPLTTGGGIIFGRGLGAGGGFLTN